MKETFLPKIQKQNEAVNGGLIKIHLLVSVHPNNRVKDPKNENDKDYQILILNPKYHEYFALIRQIAVIQPYIDIVVDDTELKK